MSERGNEASGPHRHSFHVERSHRCCVKIILEEKAIPGARRIRAPAAARHAIQQGERGTRRGRPARGARQGVPRPGRPGKDKADYSLMKCSR
ncbi:hypothetical protein BN2497_11471 [Janthinobacterium sp. CG23_2]|nr:hypothetical protein BN2497_11471 [Janthinobacterium sp. CG23_2]CUU32133.1 hypothetical protein BN3177_11471 [Janthinobacterium sp. CG23_2]